MRLIDADALEKTITEEFHGISATGFIYFMRDKTPIDVYNRVRDLIDNAPTVLHDNYSMGYQDGVKKVLSERPAGHWIRTISENGVTSAARCSECGFGDNQYMLFRYCPNCGADMQEVHIAMKCKHVECCHFKVCMEWCSLGNKNYINDSYGECEHYSTADFQIPSQMRLSELRTLLDNYDDKDMVQLRVYGSSDCPSADLAINDNTIMSDEY